MKALVVGGTGFMGMRLVSHLLREGDEVTLLTSGRRPSPFGDDVSMVMADVFDRKSFTSAVADLGYFDILFDQLCFDAVDARLIVDTFSGRIGRCIIVSSGAVYRDTGTPVHVGEYTEEEFDPTSHVPGAGGMNEVGYAEGKRNAEAYLFQNAPFPVAAARFPVVIGHDDTTLRFQDCVGSIMSGVKVVIPPGGGRRNFIWVDDAGRFLHWLGATGKSGAYNGASVKAVTAVEIAERMAAVVGRNVHVELAESASKYPFYYTPADALISPARAVSEGFTFTQFEKWFDQEVKKAAEGKGSDVTFMDIISQKK